MQHEKSNLLIYYRNNPSYAMTTKIYNILKQIDADVMVNMALYLSEDVSRLSTPIDQILDLSKEYEYKCTKSPKFCLGFAWAYSYRNLYKNVMEHPDEKPNNHKLETYPDYDRVIMDDCFREYIRRRTILIQVKQFADQGDSQEIHQKCYEVLYGELKEELQLLQKSLGSEELCSLGTENLIRLVYRLVLSVEKELPYKTFDSSKLKSIVPKECWSQLEEIADEVYQNISTAIDLAKVTYQLQQEGMIKKDLYPKFLMTAFKNTYGPIVPRLDSFTRALDRQKSVQKA